MDPFTFILDYSKRHCWENDCNLLDKMPFQHGQTEFLRWIREFGVLAPNIVRGFPDGSLKLGLDETYRGE
jgi:hypothetical protein